MTTLTYLFADNANTTLAASITAASSSLQVIGGAGSLFPNPAAAQAFIFTLVKNGSSNVYEICIATGRSGDNFTGLLRGREGTTPLAWSAGDTVAMFPTSGTAAAFAQTPQLQAQSPNYAIDTGAANAYSVALTPPLNGHVIGMPIRFLAAHANTGDSTFNDGVGSGHLYSPEGSILIPNQIATGAIYEAIWDGSVFRLQGRNTTSFAMLFGTILNAQVPLSAVAQWESDLDIAFSQLFGKPTTLGGYGITDGITAALAAATYATLASFAHSLAQNGFQKLSGGYIIQQGLCNPNGGSTTVTFPLTFPTAAFVANATGLAAITQTNVTSLSNGSMVVQNTGGQSYWIAVGH